MEGQARIKPKIAAVIIILFHAVGLLGMMISTLQPLFLRIVPLHLLLMFIVLLGSHDRLNIRFLVFVMLTYIAGFAAEWIGVHKQWLFGDYAYGPTLGIKLWDIPLTIGLNWFMLIYAAGVTLQRSAINNLWLRVLTGAAILVLLDFLIEPVAIRFSYWHWAFGIIPAKNYLGWFVVSAIMLWLFEQFKFLKQSWVGPLLLGIQFLFFAILANTDIAM